MDRRELINSLSQFPKSPGVYIMKDANSRYLYIGKAVNLRSRVKSYFLDKHKDRFQIPYMLNKIASIEWIATNNETEALILEANLVKKHMPPYNLDLKDDKHYPYLKVTVNEPFPRLIVVRRVMSDGAQYFGPFTETGTMRRVMNFAKKIFMIRNCKRKLPPGKATRPCINYSIYRCTGPCTGNISQKDYRQNVSMLIQFLKGQRRNVINLLKERMVEASEHLEYERAASLRDQINLIQRASRLQRVDLKTPKTDFDVFGAEIKSRSVCLCILSFRQGLLLSKRHFILSRRPWDTSTTGREALILQYYRNSLGEPPNEIILPPQTGFNKSLLESWFIKQHGKKVRTIIPKKGVKKDLISLAEKNARLYLAQKVPKDTESDIRELAEMLKLPRIPETIEAFDISNLGDKYAVAGMVHFANGAPVKSNYRRYKIKTVEGQNDFAMLLEAVKRRLTRLHNEQKGFPDLLLIDGGKGQLSSAAKPLSAFLEPPMIISLAKKDETIFSPYSKKPIQLSPTHPVRKLVERIRDEAHRWVLSYHRAIRGKQFKKSSLENIPGIGKKRAAALLRKFGSIKRIKAAPACEVAKVKGFSLSLAEKVLNLI